MPSALNIIAMNHSPLLLDELAAEPKPIEKQEVHYWHVQRKARRGRKWIYVQQYFCTKAEMAKVWVKFYRDGNHRLKHLMKY